MKRFLCSLLVSGILVIAVPCLHAQNNENWKLVKKADGILVFSKKHDSTKYKTIRAETEVKTSLASLVKLLTDAPNNKNWVYLNKKTTVLERTSPFRCILYSQSDVPWPVTDRDVVSEMTISQDTVSKIITVNGKALPYYLPENPHYIRIPYAVSQWKFIPQKNGKVQIIFTMTIDVGGKVPYWIANLSAAKGPFQTLRKLKNELKKEKYRNAYLPFIKEPGRGSITTNTIH